MESKEYYISLITSHTEELRKEFGVKSLRLFGSVTRNEQKVGSDIDICVDIEANAFLVVRLKRFLEELLQCSVDIVRLHKHINPFLFQEIERDGIDQIKQMELDEKRRGSIDFTAQLEKARNILKFSGFYNI